ncbi:MAG: hypothetical protein HN685_03035, partial [Waddliaceae bacterium]|nr:hypothetical protein [Waddliaceae bacterium]
MTGFIKDIGRKLEHEIAGGLKYFSPGVQKTSISSGRMVLEKETVDGLFFAKNEYLEKSTMDFMFEYGILNLVSAICDPALRSVFLAKRVIKTAASLGTMILSPVSKISNKRLPQRMALPQASEAGMKLLSNVRHLSADVFEVIGVVVCRFFIALSNFMGILAPKTGVRAYKKISQTQVKVEKLAEVIAGDKNLSLLAEDLETMRSLLRDAKIIIDVEETISDDKSIVVATSSQESDNVSKVDASKIIHDIYYEISSIRNISDRRRVVRDYEKAVRLEGKCREAFSEVGDVLSDKIATIVIPQQQEKLRLLQQLGNIPEGTMPALPAEESEDKNSRLETRLKVFDDLRQEIKRATEQLQKQYDSRGIIKESIDSMYKQVAEFQQDYYYKEYEGVLLPNFRDIERILKHFDPVTSALCNIKDMYDFEYYVSRLKAASPEEAETIRDEVSNNFFRTILTKISKCSGVFEKCKRSWVPDSPVDEEPQEETMSRETALEILGVEEGT